MKILKRNLWGGRLLRLSFCHLHTLSAAQNSRLECERGEGGDIRGPERGCHVPAPAKFGGGWWRRRGVQEVQWSRGSTTLQRNRTAGNKQCRVPRVWAALKPLNSLPAEQSTHTGADFQHVFVSPTTFKLN